LKPKPNGFFDCAATEKVNGIDPSGEGNRLLLPNRSSTLLKSMPDTDTEGERRSSRNAACERSGVASSLVGDDKLLEDDDGLRSVDNSEPKDVEREAIDDDRDGAREASDIVGLS